MKQTSRFVLVPLVLAVAGCGTRPSHSATANAASSARDLSLASDSSVTQQVVSAVELGLRPPSQPDPRNDPKQLRTVLVPTPEPEPDPQATEVMTVHELAPHTGTVSVAVLSPGQTATSVPAERGSIQVASSRGTGSLSDEGAVRGFSGGIDKCTPSRPRIGNRPRPPIPDWRPRR